MITRVPRDDEVSFSARARGDSDELAFFDSISDRYAHPKILELGCGEGRSAGQLAAKYPTWRITCFNLKGYKHTSRGPPIGGAVSFESEHEIIKMLDHYNIRLPTNAKVPRVVLGDASKIPWPFDDNTFNLMLSQATLSKIHEVDAVVKEAGRSLAKGGIALFGFGGATCKKNFWGRKLEDRVMFCGDADIAGSNVRIYLMHQTPFDIMHEANLEEWNANSDMYHGSMTTTLIINKANDENNFIFKCPSANKVAIFDALKHCPNFTPAWDRGMKKMSWYLNRLAAK